MNRMVKITRQSKGLFIVFFLLFLTCLHSNSSNAQEIKEGEVITIDRAISVALTNHPDIKTAEATVKVYESRLGQARSDYYPTVNINTGVTRYSSGGGDTNFTSSLNLNQNIYDFGKRESKVKIEDYNISSAMQELQNIKQQVILSVKKAYFSSLQARASLEVAKEVVRQYYNHLKKAQGFYDSGLKARYEVTKAEADLSSSKTNLLKADNTFRVSLATLKNAMSVPYAPDFDIKDVPIVKDNTDVKVDELIQRALLRRQDYLSLKLKQKAQESRIDLQKAGGYPSITGSMQYNVSGDKTPFDKNWSVGAMLTMPIFTGFNIRYQVEEALATLNTLKYQTDALMQKIILEVRQAYLNMIEAGQRIESARITLKYAEENLELANGRYAAGIGSPIEVSDALATYSSAKNSVINAEYDYNIAVAELKKAVGE